MEKITKLLNWASWASFAVGVLMILIGVFSGVFIGRSVIPAVDHMSTYFHMANCFFLITISLFIFNLRNVFKNE